MNTHIPADMQDFIDSKIGHQDYAPYVLDGQTAGIPGDDDDYHDVIVVEDTVGGVRVTKFTRYPSGAIYTTWQMGN